LFRGKALKLPPICEFFNSIQNIISSHMMQYMERDYVDPWPDSCSMGLPACAGSPCSQWSWV
jgi:hypothetical protein